MPEMQICSFLPYDRKNEEMRWQEKMGITILERVKNKRLLQVQTAVKEKNRRNAV